MRIFQQLGFQVTFVPIDMTFFDGYSSDLQRMGVECLHLPWIDSAQEAIRQYGPKACIVVLCRLHVAAALIDLLQHPERWAALGQAARQTVLDSYTIERIAQQYERLFLRENGVESE